MLSQNQNLNFIALTIKDLVANTEIFSWLHHFLYFIYTCVLDMYSDDTILSSCLQYHNSENMNFPCSLDYLLYMYMKDRLHMP